jgi:hypothetical protein
MTSPGVELASVSLNGASLRESGTNTPAREGETSKDSGGSKAGSAAAALTGGVTTEAPAHDGESNIIVFFNSRSGGQKGKDVEHALREHLSPDR